MGELRNSTFYKHEATQSAASAFSSQRRKSWGSKLSAESVFWKNQNNLNMWFWNLDILQWRLLQCVCFSSSATVGPTSWWGHRRRGPSGGVEKRRVGHYMWRQLEPDVCHRGVSRAGLWYGQRSPVWGSSGTRYTGFTLFVQELTQFQPSHQGWHWGRENFKDFQKLFKRMHYDKPNVR